MRYSVLWTRLAEQDLATIWLDAVDRNAVTAAASAIDRLLSRNPESQGEVLFDTVRSLRVPALGVEFEVDRTGSHRVCLKRLGWGEGKLAIIGPLTAISSSASWSQSADLLVFLFPHIETNELRVVA